MLSAVRRRIVAMSVACALWPDPSLRAAAPSATVEALPPVEADPLAAAKEHHAEGQARFDAANYTGAIDSWTAALKALPSNDDRSAPYRPYVLYNIAAAREKLFAIHGDVSQLRQAKILLERFDASIDEVYADKPETAETERKRVREKIAALDARIAEHEGKSTTPTDPVPTTEPEPTNTDVTPTNTDGPQKPDKSAVGLTVGGGVMIGIGLAALGGFVASMVISKQSNDISDLDPDDTQGRADQFAKGERANNAAIAMGILSPLFLAGGVAMLVVGAKRAKKNKVSLVPSVGGRFAGFVLQGRF
jgi:hypothetical protein